MSSLNQILVKYLKTNDIQYPTLDDVPRFKEYFINYLRVVWKTPEESLETRYKIDCNNLSHGRAWREVRWSAVHGLHFHCGLKQYQIANLLGVNVRTIRRDMRYLEQLRYGR